MSSLSDRAAIPSATDILLPDEIVPEHISAQFPRDLPTDLRASYRPQSLAISRASQRATPDPATAPVWSLRIAEDGSGGSLNCPQPGLNEFHLIRVIGQGGFGEIWEATQRSLGRVVAVKRMKRDLLKENDAGPETAKMLEGSFHQEALTTANLDHPNILPVYDLGLDENGRPMLAMKRVRGKSWEQELDDDRRIMGEVDYLAKHLPVLLGMAQAVSFAHSRGIVHRDLKPGQVMVGEFGEVLLMDWGLAIVYDPQQAHMEGSTFVSSGLAPTRESAANPAGTIAFMAPEQTEKDCAHIGPWTDVYLLGGTLYYLLTGTVPHRAAGNVAAFYKAMKGVVEPPQFRVPFFNVPEELSALCLRALDPDPAKRQPTVKAFIDGVNDYLRGAGKREESIGLLRQARDLQLKPGHTYEDMGRAGLALERAIVLWPGNPEQPPLAERNALEFAQLALRNKDTVLARLQAQRVQKTEDREAILRSIDRIEERRRLSSRQRLMLNISLIVLGAVVIVGVWQYTMQERRSRELLSKTNNLLAEERDGAMQAKSAALSAGREERAAREQAEQLVSFLADDFAKELKSIGRLPVVKKVSDQLLQYYGNQATGVPATSSAQSNKARAFIMAGGVAFASGRLDEGKQRMSQAAEILTFALDKDPKNPGVRVDLADVYIDIGSGNMQQGNLDAAQSYFQLALGLAKGLVAEAATAEHRQTLGSARFSLSWALWEGGAWDEALVSFEESLRIFEQLRKEDPNNSEYMETLAQLHEGLVIILMADDRMAEAIASQKESLELRRALSKAQPWNPSQLAFEAGGQLYLGKAYEEDGQLEAALASYREGFDQMTRVLQQDPAVGARRLRVAEFRNHMGNIMRRIGRVQQAEAGHREALAMLATLASLDASNQEVMFELARTKILLAQCADALGAPDARQQMVAAVDELEAVLNAEDEARLRVPYLEWYAKGLLLVDKRDAARIVLADLSQRRVRNRELYEMAEARGLLSPPAIKFQLRVRAAPPSP